MSLRNIMFAPFKMANTFFTNWKNFNLKIAWYKTINIVTWHFENSKLYEYVYSNLNNSILNFLEDNLKEDIDKFLSTYTYRDEECKKNIPPIIWQSWWQGEDGLNGITKVGTSSIKENANDIQVIMVTKDNYKNYVEIPDIIFKWLDSGKISRTHFADYLRMSLLSQNGGIWFDCAIFASKSIDSSTLNYSFYSPKGTFRNYRYISFDEWSTGCMGCRKHFPMMDMYLVLYEAYFKKFDIIIDYYLTDFLMRISYNHIPEVKYAVDKVPYNNPAKQDMTLKLNEKYDEHEYNKLIEHTTIFKLSRKIDLTEKTRKGDHTLYGFLKQKYNC